MTREYETLFAENFSFWEHLTEDQKDMLCRSATLATYPKGVNLHNGSEECAGLLYIKSGQLRAYLLSEDGREVTLYRLYPGDICILSASCVLDAITFDVSVDTVEKSEILTVSASAFHKLVTENVYVEALRLPYGGRPFFRRYVGHAANPFHGHGQTAGNLPYG